MMSLVIFILDISKLETEKLVMVCGHAAKQKQERLLLVEKININSLNGLMKKLKSTSMISQ